MQRSKQTRPKSVSDKQLAEYHRLDVKVKAAEGWGKTAEAHKATFKKLLLAQSKFELALKKHFKDLAKRSTDMVNWAQYHVDLIKAYDYVANLDDLEFTNEQDLLLQIMQAYVLEGMALGVDFSNDAYVVSGLSPTSAEVQKAALTRSSKLVTQITEGTRAKVQQSIATSFTLGETVDDAKNRLADLLDDPSRAETIARTEIRNSYADGANQAAIDAGATTKAWDPSSNPCELCLANVDDGTIGIDEDFTNGDDPHPNCLCGAPVFGGFGEGE